MVSNLLNSRAAFQYFKNSGVSLSISSVLLSQGVSAKDKFNLIQISPHYKGLSLSCLVQTSLFAYLQAIMSIKETLPLNKILKKGFFLHYVYV
jgi:hypothetical protein